MRLAFREQSRIDGDGQEVVQFTVSDEQTRFLSRYRSARLHQSAGQYKVAHDAMMEVIGWCYDQFGTPLVGRWSCSAAVGSVEFHDPNEATAFKMRWL